MNMTPQTKTNIPSEPLRGFTPLEASRTPGDNLGAKKSSQSKELLTGFTLLLTLLFTATLLAIGLTLYSLTIKEFDLSLSLRDSIPALYAAETGYECVIYWDVVQNAFRRVHDGEPPLDSIQCDGTTIPITEPSPKKFIFTLTFSDYKVEIDADDTSQFETLFEARGFNTSQSVFPRKIRKRLTGTTIHVPQQCIGITSLPGDIVIDFTKDYYSPTLIFDEVRHYVLWNLVPGGASPPYHYYHGHFIDGHSFPDKPPPLPIPAGTYDILLVAWDDHLIKINQFQPYEQWYLRLYNDAGAPIFTSNATTDLPNRLELLIEQVNTEVELEESARYVSIHHRYNPSDPPPDGNGHSIFANCAVLRPS